MVILRGKDIMERRILYRLIGTTWAWNPHKYIDPYELVSISTAAMMLGRSLRTLRKWESRKLMPPRQKRGKTYYYREADIEFFRQLLEL